MGTRTRKLKNIYVGILEQKKFRVEVVYIYTSKNFNIDHTIKGTAYFIICDREI
jgi:hypothetical protein